MIVVVAQASVVVVVALGLAEVTEDGQPPARVVGARSATVAAAMLERRISLGV